MQVNLKKAAALAAALAAVPMRIDHSFKVDAFGDPIDQPTILRLMEQLKEQIAASASRDAAVFKIRSMIGVANQARISDLLNSRAEIEKNLSVLGAIPIRRTAPNLPAMARQMEAIRGGDAPRLFVGREVVLELETDSIVTPAIKAWRKSLRKIDDELQQVNFTTIIELPDEVVAVLKDHDLD